MILIMRERVRDYDAWKPNFDAGEQLRAKHGCSGHTVHRGDDDANDLTVQLHFPSREAANAFFADPELAENMKRAGVETRPAVTFVREAESRKYAERRAA